MCCFRCGARLFRRAKTLLERLWQLWCQLRAIKKFPLIRPRTTNKQKQPKTISNKITNTIKLWILENLTVEHWVVTTDFLQRSHLHPLRLLSSWLSHGAPFNDHLGWFDAVVARHTLIVLSLSKVNPARIQFGCLAEKEVLQWDMNKSPG